jgi:hypothetical protein
VLPSWPDEQFPHAARNPALATAGVPSGNQLAGPANQRQRCPHDVHNAVSAYELSALPLPAPGVLRRWSDGSEEAPAASAITTYGLPS